MTTYRIDPLSDARWSQFLDRHPDASIFHTPGWLKALYRTYGFEPVVYTTSGPGQDLTNGVPFCRINSWLTGQRLISLPFADHCQPLVDQPEVLQDVLRTLENDCKTAQWKYIQLRPLRVDGDLIERHTHFGGTSDEFFHAMPLGIDEQDLFRGLHKSCVQRPIRRAAREGFTYEEGISEALLAKFYQLLVMTRRRHQIPPQPIIWFRNLIDCLGDRLKIRVASKDGKPIASIITLSYQKSVVYKYGCSDPKHYNLGGMIALLWQAIQEAKKQGADYFDLGRSARSNTGLVEFKDRWGASRSPLTYYKYPMMRGSPTTEGWKMHLANHIFSRLPDRILTAAGNVLYRHIE
ncbi:MAG: GNAT family N-acetyltransferase [Candidatus Tectomicrobia bacterium]|nr:GNAT family N-acetyltransferase [Candidatus Tectomicrobia bacterium]